MCSWAIHHAQLAQPPTLSRGRGTASQKMGFSFLGGTGTSLACSATMLMQVNRLVRQHASP